MILVQIRCAMSLIFVEKRARWWVRAVIWKTYRKRVTYARFRGNCTRNIVHGLDPCKFSERSRRIVIHVDDQVEYSHDHILRNEETDYSPCHPSTHAPSHSCRLSISVRVRSVSALERPLTAEIRHYYLPRHNRSAVHILSRAGCSCDSAVRNRLSKEICEIDAEEAPWCTVKERKKMNEQRFWVH